jgi:hypothetical protein
MAPDDSREASPCTLELVPDGVDPSDIADGCREAFVEFCRGVASGWTKRDLALWLAGPYARVARLIDTHEDENRASAEALAAVTPSRISELLDPAWQDAVSCVEDLARGIGVRWLDEAFEHGSVIEAALDDEYSVFVPHHRPRLTLALRVRSLIVADFLLRPEEYRGEVRACNECGVVLLGIARRRGQCLDHLLNSDMRPTAEGLALEELMPMWRQSS